MSEHGHEHSYEHLRTEYLKIFAWLLAFTALTVAAAELPNWGFVRTAFESMGYAGVILNMTIGLVIATIKVCMVMYIFMHLKFDNKYLRAFVAVPVFLLIVMVFALTVLESFNHP